MLMAYHPVMHFSRLPCRVHVNHHQCEVRKDMKELVTKLGCDTMAFRHRPPRINRDVDLRVQAMPEPTRTDFRNLLHLGNETSPDFSN